METGDGSEAHKLILILVIKFFVSLVSIEDQRLFVPRLHCM